MLRLFICIRLMVSSGGLGSSSTIHLYVDDAFVRLYGNVVARIFYAFMKYAFINLIIIYSVNKIHFYLLKAS